MEEANSISTCKTLIKESYKMNNALETMDSDFSTLLWGFGKTVELVVQWTQQDAQHTCEAQRGCTELEHQNYTRLVRNILAIPLPAPSSLAMNKKWVYYWWV